MEPFATSVVIPTRGRPALLERGLEALCRQSIAADRYEVTVVDDGPTPETRAVVEHFAPQMTSRGLVIHYVPSDGPSNIGRGSHKKNGAAHRRGLHG